MSGDCLPATGSFSAGTNTWSDTPHQATVTVQNAASCARTYVLSTTGPLRDNNPSNPRTYTEQAGQPLLRTGHDMLDALFALAIEESREASVRSFAVARMAGGTTEHNTLQLGPRFRFSA